MPLPLFGFYGFLPAFMLVLFRVSGLMLTAPVFSSMALPVQIRALLAAAISLTIFPMTLSSLPAQLTLAQTLAGMLGELAVGVLLGLAVNLVFMGVELAAEAVGQMSGMRLGEVFNPLLESSAGAMGELYTLVAMMIFLAIRGDHALIGALLDSFQSIPPLGAVPTEGLIALLLDLLNLAFTITIRVGGPMVLALMLALMCFGFLSRTIPQLHLMSVGFPLKVAVCLAVAAMTMVSMEGVLVEGLREAFDAIRIGLGLLPDA